MVYYFQYVLVYTMLYVKFTYNIVYIHTYIHKYICTYVNVYGCTCIHVKSYCAVACFTHSVRCQVDTLNQQSDEAAAMLVDEMKDRLFQYQHRV